MSTYEGQPEYVVVGYLTDLFEGWAQTCPNDEWGGYMTAMWHLLDAAVRVSDEDRAAVVAGWFRAELQRAWDEDWWDVRVSWYEWEGIYAAQDAYEEITASWRERAVSFKGEAALEATIAGLPDWVRPGPVSDRLPRPDREREEYERLKAKYEK